MTDVSTRAASRRARLPGGQCQMLAARRDLPWQGAGSSASTVLAFWKKVSSRRRSRLTRFPRSQRHDTPHATTTPSLAEAGTLTERYRDIDQRAIGAPLLSLPADIGTAHWFDRPVTGLTSTSPLRPQSRPRFPSGRDPARVICRSSAPTYHGLWRARS